MKINWLTDDADKKGVYDILIDGRSVFIGYTARSFKKSWTEQMRNMNQLKHNRKVKSILNDGSVIEFRVLKYCRTINECRHYAKVYINRCKPDLNVKRKGLI